MTEIEREIWRRNARFRAWSGQLSVEGIWQTGEAGTVLRMGCRKCMLSTSGWRASHSHYQLSTTFKLTEIECAQNLGRGGCPHLIPLQNPNPDPSEIQTLTQLELLLDALGATPAREDVFAGYTEWRARTEEKPRDEEEISLEESPDLWPDGLEETMLDEPTQEEDNQAQLLVPETKPRPRILEPEPGIFSLRMEIAAALRVVPPVDLPGAWVLSRDEFLEKVRQRMQHHFSQSELKESDLGDASFFVYADFFLKQESASAMLRALPAVKVGLTLLEFIEHNLDDGNVLTVFWQKVS